MAEWTVGIVRFDHRDEDDDGVGDNNVKDHENNEEFNKLQVKLPAQSADLQTNFWLQ